MLRFTAGLHSVMSHGAVRERVSIMETNETNERSAVNAAPYPPVNIGMPPQMPPVKQKSGAWKVVVAVVLLLGVFGSTAVSTFTLFTLKDYIVKREEGENTETSEDYVKIAEQYEILPTTAISDAYKSGDTSALDDKQKETLDMAKAALDEMEITEDMTDYDREKAVYDWMTTSLQQDRGALVVIPRTQEDCDNPYGVLKYHNAVCVGYATTFRMFMQMMDIECMVEHNTEKYHSWNLVKLDGDWYITDIYSDAGQNNYAHFNMNDTMWGQQQNWDHDYFPAATSLKYNMAYQERKEVDTVYDTVKAMREAMNEKKGSVMIRFKEEITDENAQIVSALTTAVDNALMAGNYKDMPYCLNTWNWLQDPEDDSYVFCVYMGGYNSTSNNQNGELSEEEMKKVQEAVTKAFEDLTPAGGEPGGIDEGGSGDTGDAGTANTAGAEPEQAAPEAAATEAVDVIID